MKQLRFSLENLAQLFNAIPDPIFVKDQEHRWIFANEAFARLLGRPLSECLNKSDYDVFPKEIADAFWKKDDEIFASGRPDETEERILSPSGEMRAIVTQKTPILAADGMMLIGVIRDVTEQKEAARRSLELARLNTFSEIASGLAHDINNPITIVKGRAQQLSRLIESGQASPASISHLARSIEASADRAMHVIAELRKLGEASAMRAERAIEVKSLLSFLPGLFKSRFEALGVSLKIRLESESLRVYGVEAEIRQALIALTQYSLHSVYDAPARSILWSAHPPTAPSDRRVRLRLSDSAPREKGEDGPRTTATTGGHAQFALGLSTVEAIVAAHGGALRAGQGDEEWRFELSLPSEAKPSGAAA